MIYLDFEYRGESVELNKKNRVVRVPKDPSELVLMAFCDSQSSEVQVLDLRTTEGREQAKRQVSIWMFSGETLVSFNANAEIGCLLSLGIDVRPIKFIDLMVEARMISLTHSKYRQRKGSLLETLLVFGVRGKYSELFKDDTRNLILSTNDYSPQEWEQIVEYGKSDVAPMPDLFLKIARIHNESKTGTTLDEMRFRGEVIKATTALDWNSKGYPVDLDRLEAIFGRSDEVREELARAVNDKYCPEIFDKPIYLRNKKGGYTFKKEAFAQMLERKGIAWDRTASGQPRTDSDYIEEKTRTHPYLIDLYRTMRTFVALKSSDLRLLESGGYIRAVQHHYTQVTSRSSPKPSQGFLLNLTPWLRSALIRPKRGEVFVGVDWKSQEIGIAAAISQDENLLEAYKGRDVYLALAIKAGAIPPLEDTDDAWKAAKKKYSTIRQNFKSVQLGINYGKGLKALIQDVYNNSVDENGEPTIELIEAERTAKKIFQWHQITFSKYWDYIDDRIKDGHRDGLTKTREGWVYFIDDKTKDTQLKNLPSQSEAAHMLHRAVLNVYETGELEMVCSLHDAIYIRTTEKEAAYHIGLLKECMGKACEQVLGSRLIGGDVLGPYTHDNPYWDGRGAEQYRTIASILGSVMDHPKAKK